MGTKKATTTAHTGHKIGPKEGEFKHVVIVDKQVGKAQGNAWEAQARHFLAVVSKLPNIEAMKEVYKTLEKAEKDEGWTPSNVYMSNKSVILRASRLEVELLNKAGHLKGKTEVQNACNDLEKTEKTPFQKFQDALGNATKYFDKLDTSQVPAAFMLMKEAYTKANERTAATMAKAA